MSAVLPIRDWSNAIIRAETATKKGSDALLLHQFSEAFDQFSEAKRQLEYALFWINREAGK